MAGNGNEKPKLEKAWPTLAVVMPPMPKPSAVEPQAMIEPTAIATSPAGMPLK